MTKSKIVAFVAALALFGASSASAAYMFNMNLGFGMRNSDVTELQLRLNSEVGTSLPGTTYFGSLTKTAVKSYQTMKGISPVSGYVGPLTRASLNGSSSSNTNTNTGNLPAGCTTTSGFSPISGVPCSSSSSSNTQTGPVTASLAMTNPASGVLVAGQATANMAQFAFNGTGTVTNVTLKRIGVSADSTPSNVYLFDGATRLTDAASVSSTGMVTFNVPAGVFSVAGSKTITVKSDIASGTSGQTVGFTLVSFATSAGTTTVNLSGNVHSIASATLATVTHGTVTPTGATLNPGAAVTLWQDTFTISQRDVMMKRLALRQVGSAPASAFQNFKLYVNGVQVATAAGIDSMGYVTFDMSATPATLVSGSRVVRVDADIVSGASRTVQLSLRQASDVDFVDSSFGVNITPTSTPWTSAAANTISGTSGGSLTIEKDISSPSKNATLSGSDVNFGTFKVTAYGEPIKIETLTAGFTFTDGGTVNAAATLRNGRLLINGTQYGSSATLLAAGTSFTTNYTVYPGTPVMVEIHADVYDNDGTGALDSSDTIKAKIVAGSSNAQRIDSLGSFSAPATAVDANTLSIASASITLTKNGTFADQSTTLPSTNTKIGSWNLVGSSVEDVLLTTLSFDVAESTGTEFDEGDITQMYVVVKNSGGTIVAQPSPIATLGTGADQNFSINYTLAKNTSLSIELYANLADDGLDMVAGVSGGSDAIDTTDAFNTILMVSGTSMVSGQTVTSGNGSSTIAGQAIAYAAASITATIDSSSPVKGIVYDSQTVTSAAFKLASVTSSYDITDVTLSLTATGATVVSSVMLYDGATLVGTQAGGTTSVTFSDIVGLNVPANTNKVLTVKLVLGTIGYLQGTSAADLTTTLTAFTASNKSTGVSAAGTESNPASAVTSAFAAIPKVDKVLLPCGSDIGANCLTNGSGVPLMRFTITGNGGPIAWNHLYWDVTADGTTVIGTSTSAGISLYDVTGGANTVVAGTFTNSASIVTGGTSTSGTIKFIPTAEEQVSTSKTYELRGTVASANAAGDFVSVTIANDSTSAVVALDTYANIVAADSDAPIIWSDMSASAHATTTADWTSDFGVKNLPVSQTVSWPN